MTRTSESAKEKKNTGEYFGLKKQNKTTYNFDNAATNGTLQARGANGGVTVLYLYLGKRRFIMFSSFSEI